MALHMISLECGKYDSTFCWGRKPLHRMGQWSPYVRGELDKGRAVNATRVLALIALYAVSLLVCTATLSADSSDVRPLPQSDLPTEINPAWQARFDAVARALKERQGEWYYGLESFEGASIQVGRPRSSIAKPKLVGLMIGAPFLANGSTVVMETTLEQTGRQISIYVLGQWMPRGTISVAQFGIVFSSYELDLTEGDWNLRLVFKWATDSYRLRVEGDSVWLEPGIVSLSNIGGPGTAVPGIDSLYRR